MIKNILLKLSFLGDRFSMLPSLGRLTSLEVVFKGLFARQIPNFRVIRHLPTQIGLNLSLSEGAIRHRKESCHTKTICCVITKNIHDTIELTCWYKRVSIEDLHVYLDKNKQTKNIKHIMGTFDFTLHRRSLWICQYKEGSTFRWF
jgi:hypothetical protein